MVRVKKVHLECRMQLNLGKKLKMQVFEEISLLLFKLKDFFAKYYKTGKFQFTSVNKLTNKYQQLENAWKNLEILGKNRKKIIDVGSGRCVNLQL